MRAAAGFDGTPGGFVRSRRNRRQAALHTRRDWRQALIAIKLSAESCRPRQAEGSEMDFGVLMFFTDYAISAIDLAKAL
jgi:hypothetical protein